MEIGGAPVSYDNVADVLRIAGKDYTKAEWSETTRRIRTLTSEDGKAASRKEGPDGPLPPHEGRGSSFLTVNVMEIIERKVGRILDPPVWLRPFFSGVITKERLNG